jgi:hypothetical protein
MLVMERSPISSKTKAACNLAVGYLRTALSLAAFNVLWSHTSFPFQRDWQCFREFYQPSLAHGIQIYSPVVCCKSITELGANLGRTGGHGLKVPSSAVVRCKCPRSRLRWSMVIPVTERSHSKPKSHSKHILPYCSSKCRQLPLCS